MDEILQASNPLAVVLTAIPVEYKAVRQHLTDVRELIHPKGNVYESGLFLGDYHHWRVGIAEVGIGNATSSRETERAIAYFKPEVILFVGVAGGIKDLALGDVVVADKAYGYERGKVVKNGFLPRPEIGKSSFALLERAKAEARKEDWKSRIKTQLRQDPPNCLVKPIAAGEKVIASTRGEIFKLINKGYSDAVAVEMEGHGFFEACSANEGVHFLIVRGISDLLANKAEADAHGSQEFASQTASAFAFQVLSKFKIK